MSDTTDKSTQPSIRTYKNVKTMRKDSPKEENDSKLKTKSSTELEVPKIKKRKFIAKDISEILSSKVDDVVIDLPKEEVKADLLVVEPKDPFEGAEVDLKPPVTSDESSSDESEDVPVNSICSEVTEVDIKAVLAGQKSSAPQKPKKEPPPPQPYNYKAKFFCQFCKIPFLIEANLINHIEVDHQIKLFDKLEPPTEGFQISLLSSSSSTSLPFKPRAKKPEVIAKLEALQNLAVKVNKPVKIPNKEVNNLPYRPRIVMHPQKPESSDQSQKVPKSGLKIETVKEDYGDFFQSSTFNDDLHKCSICPLKFTYKSELILHEHLCKKKKLK